MKKTFLITIFSLLVLNLNAQKSTGTIKDNDKLTMKAYKLLEEYLIQNFNYWDEKYSDNAIIRYNNMLLDKKTFLGLVKQDFVLFNNISIDPSDHDDNYAHTNYFTNGVNKGDIWTNHWFIWSGTGKTLGLRYSARVHVDTKWENDKVAEQLFMLICQHIKWKVKCLNSLNKFLNYIFN